jgi:hypothetical protein
LEVLDDEREKEVFDAPVFLDFVSPERWDIVLLVVLGDSDRDVERTVWAEE